ncbi:Phosphatidylinositol 4-kinase pik1alpha (PI4-kinase)(PtdIns-4-kinase) [Chytriomyces hyalinus]|nr:Phosphatidylinositol 4-kinase pik1alpha (PI4-kinase)(PtdIns-4-kinase) [Chytriomyces hyalinus]
MKDGSAVRPLHPAASANEAERKKEIEAAIGSGLLRLFQSDFFDARLALHYLHLYPRNAAIESYVCNALRDYSEADAEFWMPQIVHLMVERGGSNLENLLIHQATHSDHMAILTLWQLQTYLTQGGRLSSTSSGAAEQLQRVYQRTQQILFGRQQPALLPQSEKSSPPIVNSHASAQSRPDKQPSQILTESTNTIRPQNPELLKRTMSPDSEESSIGFYKVDGSAPLVTPTTAGGADAGLEADDEDSPTGSMSASFSSSMEGGPSGNLHQAGADVFNPMKESVIFVDHAVADKLDAELSTSVIRTAYGRGSLAFESKASNAYTSMAESKFVSFPLSAPSIEEMGLGTAFNRGIKHSKNSKTVQSGSNQSGSDESNDSGRQSDVEWMLVNKPDYTYIEDPRMRYFHSQLQFIMTLADISDRLRSVPKAARQNALFGELSLINYNLPANVCIPLWCDGGSHDKHHHWIVRVPQGDGVTLNSADRVPYLLIVEIVDHLEDAVSDEPEDEPGFISEPETAISKLKRESSALASRASSLSLNNPDASTNSEENAEYYKSVINRRNHMSPTQSTPPSSIAAQQPAVATSSSSNLSQPGTPKRPHSRAMSTGSLLAATTAVDEYTQKMRTAAVMLAQLYQQQAAAAGSPGGSTPGSPSNMRLKHGGEGGAGNSTAAGVGGGSGGMKVDFEAIRHKLVQEMTVLEEKRLKALEEQRAAKAAAAGNSTLQRSVSDSTNVLPGVAGTGQDEALPEGIEAKLIAAQVTKDKDDPSAAVFKESWDAKCARIRAGSPYGRNPTWRMVSVIVKSGSDLRQEVLALQLIKEMDRIWKEEKVPVWVHYYRVMVTSDQGGLIETIQNAISIHSIKKEGYSKQLNQPGVAYSLYDYFLQEFGAPASKKFLKAQDAFMRSLAGYSIICYLLQIKDRHNGNILIDKDGHSIHIDFGFMLSNSPGNMGFELAPFKLPQEFVDILGGTRSLVFKQYRALCKEAFLALRKRWNMIVGLVEIMEKDSVLPCFTGTSVKPSQTPSAPSTPQPPSSSSSLFSFLGSGGREVITSSTHFGETPPESTNAHYSGSGINPNNKPINVGSNPALPVSMKLKERFSLGMTENQVGDFVDRLVDSSTNSIMTKLYDAFQWYSNGVL